MLQSFCPMKQGWAIASESPKAVHGRTLVCPFLLLALILLRIFYTFYILPESLQPKQRLETRYGMGCTCKSPAKASVGLPSTPDFRCPLQIAKVAEKLNQATQPDPASGSLSPLHLAYQLAKL